jgi:hypothetical protein
MWRIVARPAAGLLSARRFTPMSVRCWMRDDLPQRRRAGIA